MCFLMVIRACILGRETRLWWCGFYIYITRKTAGARHGILQHCVSMYGPTQRGHTGNAFAVPTAIYTVVQRRPGVQHCHTPLCESAEKIHWALWTHDPNPRRVSAEQFRHAHRRSFPRNLGRQMQCKRIRSHLLAEEQDGIEHESAVLHVGPTSRE